jgi:tetratricopeptide (TPR) repeat protein
LFYGTVTDFKVKVDIWIIFVSCCFTIRLLRKEDMPERRHVVGNQENEIFVNRAGPIKLIKEAFSGIPNEGLRVLVLYGPGGQGKTALCRYIERLTKADEQKFLRTMVLDLHGKAKNDPIDLLVWIRNGFAGAGISVPAFDLTFAIFWEANRGEETFPKLINPWLGKSSSFLKEITPDLVTTVRSIVEDSVESIPFLGPITKMSGNWFMDESKKAWLHRSRDHLQELYVYGELKKPYEIAEILPWMLAQDLNEHARDHPNERFVMLIDEYEGVFDQGGAGRRWEDNQFDQYMRSFLSELNGLLAIFFTREKLPWEKESVWVGDLAGNQHRLNGLHFDDASDWVASAGVPKVFGTFLIEGAREESKPGAAIYPLLLQLQILHWHALTSGGQEITAADFEVGAQSFEERQRIIVRRLLRDYGQGLQDMIERLSVVKRFDQKTLEYLRDTFSIQVSDSSFRQLMKLSFITTETDGYSTIQRAFAEAIESTLGLEFKQQTIKSLLIHYEKRSKPKNATPISDDHINAVFEASFLRQKLSVDGYTKWLDEISEPLSIAARYSKIEELWRVALDLTSRVLGEEHPDTVMSQSALASNLRAQGRYGEAEPLSLRNVEICERLLGEDHPVTADSYNNLASNISAQGRYDEAEPLFLRNVEICERLLGEDDPATVRSYNNLASNLHAQGRYGEAEMLHRLSLEILDRLVGEDHPNTATSYNNLASTLSAQGRYDEAEPLYRLGLEICERLLVEDHPDTATSYNNLASNLNAQGRYSEAEPLHRLGLEICERSLGEDHPDTATSYNNLGSNLKAQGRYSEAEPLYRLGLEICERSLSEDHPDTATSCNNLATNLDAQGRHGEAEPLFLRNLEICERSLGEDHPRTATSYNNLALNLCDQGRYGEAEPLCRRGVKLIESALGTTHPTALAMRANLHEVFEVKDDL